MESRNTRSQGLRATTTVAGATKKSHDEEEEKDEFPRQSVINAQVRMNNEIKKVPEKRGQELDTQNREEQEQDIDDNREASQERGS